MSASLVLRTFVPPEPDALSDEFTRIDVPLSSGLPHRLELEGGFALVILLPTGRAVAWRDADPTAGVTDSAPELIPRPSSGPGGARRAAPLRAVLMRGSDVLGATALVAGGRHLLSDAGDAQEGAQFEIAVLGWDVRAGTLRGAGDFGAVVRLAWRRADRAPLEYDAPHVPRRLAVRLPAEARLESSPEPRLSR